MALSQLGSGRMGLEDGELRLEDGGIVHGCRSCSSSIY
jgi:hypothetical protein